MLLRVEIKAVKEVAVNSDPLARATRATEMRDLGLRNECNFPALVRHSPLPIALLRIHEESFVKAPDGIINFALNEQAGADHEINLSFGVVLPTIVIPEN